MGILFILAFIHSSVYPFFKYVCFALSIANEGSTVSSILSSANLANQSLNGSAFGDGTDWINLNIASLFAQSVSLIFPSF